MDEWSCLTLSLSEYYNITHTLQINGGHTSCLKSSEHLPCVTKPNSLRYTLQSDHIKSHATKMYHIIPNNVLLWLNTQTWFYRNRYFNKLWNIYANFKFTLVAQMPIDWYLFHNISCKLNLTLSQGQWI